ncbi:MAG: [FeFe] hydrogenase H-cluster radical SAM maturase HydE [Phycisphaerae bacterium]|nr:[FeFe] hydrogenase H-cluster radical SAM maturase HydE [Phycisphaerae bacterium]
MYSSVLEESQNPEQINYTVDVITKKQINCETIMEYKNMTKYEIIKWLREENPEELARLWHEADNTRSVNVGNEVHLRGLIEISNHCVRQCAYCGINIKNASISRYRMTFDEIIECAAMAHSFNYGTVVIQAGEDYGLDTEFIGSLVRHIKEEFGLAITLSLGERKDTELLSWRKARADRYLLRFETSNEQLYELIHPPSNNIKIDRVELLCKLRNIGYEIGSGVMIGIHGQSYENLADDILLFKKIDLDMIGVGPYIPHPSTSLGKNIKKMNLSSNLQVPATELMCYKVIALSRLICPEANIPSATALATLNLTNGRETGLCRGANILMPNLTPVKYRSLYEIYPSKACIFETAQQCQSCIASKIHAIGRAIGKGPGSCKKRNTGNTDVGKICSKF